MTAFAEAFVRLRVDGARLRTDITAALNASGAEASGANAGKGWAKGFESSGISKVAKKITEGVLAIGAGSVYAAVKFQASMERIHTQAGVAQAKIAGLGDGVLKLAGQVGFSPDSLSVSLYHVESAFASMGITSVKALALVKIAAEGAAVGGANLEDVTNALTAVMASGIRITGGMSGAMGTLNAIVGAGDMKMQDLADAFGTGILASIKGFGVTITDAGAALATFGDNNIRGAVAGTQLRMAIQALARPSAAGIKLMQGWGLSADAFARAMQKGGLKLALEDLQKQFARLGISSKQQGAVLTELFGKRAGVGIQILLGQMGRFESKYTDLAKGAHRFGDAVAKTQATASQQFKDLTQGLVAMGVQVGQKLLPPVMAVFNFIRSHTGLVLGVAAAVAAVAISVTVIAQVIKAYEAYRAVVAAVTAIQVLCTNAALGTRIALVALAVWTKVVAAASKVAAAAQWLLNLAMDANPVALIVIAIVALVAGILWLVLKCKPFRDFWIALWGDVLSVTAAVWDWIKGHWPLLLAILAGPIGLAVLFIIRHWADVTAAIGDGIHWLREAFAKFVDFLLGIFGDIIHMAADALGWIPGIGPKLKQAAAAFDKFRQSVNASLLGINNRTVTVGVDISTGLALGPGTTRRAATGGLVRGPGGPTDDKAGLFWLSDKEYVVNAASVARYGLAFMDAVNAGKLAAGGLAVSSRSPGAPAIQAAVWPAAEHAVRAAVAAALASGTFNALLGEVIARYAAAFAGLVPYKWGGTTTSGWDCSGFSEFVMHHFGFGSPRTAAQQQAWATPVAYPVRGGLAFFAGADGTAKNAGHVGIVLGPNLMVDAFGTGFGTRFDAIYGSSGAIGGFGIPPNRFDRGGRLPPGLSLAWNGTGRHERVTSPGQEDQILDALERQERLLAELIGAVHDNAAGTAHGVAQALGSAAGLAAHRAEYSARW